MELPAEPILAAVIRSYAAILTRHRERIGERPVVLPNGQYFPDRFVGDVGSVQRLVDRMLLHAGMEELEINAELVGAEATSCGTGGCGSGGCGTAQASPAEFERLGVSETGYVVRVHETELSHPVVLTAQLARAVAAVFLRDAEDEDASCGLPLPIAIELTAVALGFGTLLLQGAYIYQKSCGGPSVSRITELSCAELALAFALFAATGKHSVRRAAKELGATQQEFVGEARALVDSNPELVRILRSNPSRLVSGEFAIHPATSWIMRLFGSKKRKDAAALDPEASLEELEAAFASEARPKSKERKADPKFDEIRKLVDEALRES